MILEAARVGRAAGTGMQALATGLFSITCTTCQAKLRVRNVEAIGQILACPRCHSMVQVVPPPGWSGQADQAGAASAATQTCSPAAMQMGVQQAAPPVQAAQAAQPLHPLKEGQSLRGSRTALPSQAGDVPANAADTCTPAAVQATSASSAAKAHSQWFDGSDAAFRSRLRSVWKTPLACEQGQGTSWLARLAGFYMRLAGGNARPHLRLYVGAAALVVCVAAGAWLLLAKRSSDEIARRPMAAAQPGERSVAATSQQPLASASAGISGSAKRAGAHVRRKHSNSNSRAQPKTTAARAAQAGTGPDQPTEGQKPAPRQPPPAKHTASEPDDAATAEKTAKAAPAAENQGDDAAGENAGGNKGPDDHASHHHTTEEDVAGDAPQAPSLTSDPNMKPEPGEPAAPEPQGADADVLDAAEVEARLQVPLAAIELPDIALGEAVDILGQLASVRIELDVEALGDAGRSPGDRVRVSLTQTTVAEALAAVLAQYNLAYEVRQGVIWIRPR